jgi:hypothetical protein
MKWGYGDEVSVMAPDESGALERRPCVVVGITTVNNSALSNAVGWPVGTILYSVEFSDGSDTLIPEVALLPTLEASL